MNKQRTWIGDNCDNRAIEWLDHLAYCFHIRKVTMRKYIVKKSKYVKEERCQIIVKFD